MNNCQKCGNPLQPGQTTCPICGTNTSGTEIKLESTPVLNSSSLESVPPLRNETTTIVSPNETLTEMNTPNSLNELGNNTMASISGSSFMEQPNSTGIISPTTIIEKREAIQGTSSPQPSLQDFAPSVSTIKETSPIPSMPAGTTIVNQSPVIPEKKKKKFSKNQKIIILGALVLVLIAVAGVIMSSKSMKLPPNSTTNNNQTTTPENPENPDNQTIALKEAVTNGYRLKYEEGWIIVEDSYNVLMKKSDESVVIKLEHFSYNLDDFDQTVIETYLAQREGITNPTVEKTTINGNVAYVMTYDVLTQSATTYPVESYFLYGGANLILGSTIVYQNPTIKEANRNIVRSLMENVSYEDASVKALDSINMYYNAFSLYADIIGNSKKEEPVMNETTPEVPETPSEPNNGEPVQNEEQKPSTENNPVEDTTNNNEEVPTN